MNYIILHKIGQGGNSKVFEGVNRLTNKHVAIKEFAKNKDHSKEIENAQKLSDLIPELVPQYYDSFTENKKQYLVQELIHGDSLRNVWVKKNDWDFNWDSIYHVLNAIKALHKHGYAH